jgi:hypothetical protein
MEHATEVRRLEPTTGLHTGACVVVAAVTAVATVWTASSSLASASADAERLRRDVGSLTASLHAARIPVGVVVASMLAPDAFAEAAGDALPFDARRSQWAPADGRDVQGSRYQALLDRASVPDLRGIFLRGANLGRQDASRDPDGDRILGGEPQEAATAMPKAGFLVLPGGAHTHGLPSGGHAPGWGRLEEGGGGDRGIGTSSNGEHAHRLSGGDIETRPRNVAVAYFVRIN